MFFFVIILLAISTLFGGATSIFAQRVTVTPPKVQGNTPIGTINGVPVTANDIIMTINYDSPFMPPLDGDLVPVLKQYETNYSPTPKASSTPIATEQPTTKVLVFQINNMMKTAQEWLFNSLLETIVKPFYLLIFFAWVIASFILGVGFLRRFSDNKEISPEQLVRWGIRPDYFYGLNRDRSVYH